MLQFQSTLPGWGATGPDTASTHPTRNFNPRSPGGERRCGSCPTCSMAYFNPRSPGGERPDSCACPWPSRYFNPRSPGGERLDAGARVVDGDGISIHAPRVGSDWLHDNTYRQGRVISIHAPRVGSDRIVRSPLPVRVISIHAPRVGSDRENGHLRPRYGQNHPFSTLIVSQIVVDVLGTVRKSQKHQRTSHYEVIKQPERRK